MKREIVRASAVALGPAVEGAAGGRRGFIDTEGSADNVRRMPVLDGLQEEVGRRWDADARLFGETDRPRIERKVFVHGVEIRESSTPRTIPRCS